MISLIAFFFILSAGSVVCAAFYGKKYEEVLPVSSSVIVLILFVCGICGALSRGVMIVCAAAVLCYLLAAVKILRENYFYEALKNIVTPAFFLFAGVFVLLAYLNAGKMADGWDEFSHWANIVKTMVMIDDFGTNPQAQTAFASYPPGMSLMQYFVQKLYVMCQSGSYSEWRLYFTYQIFLWTYFLPFLNCKSKNKFSVGIVFAVAFFLCPLLFYQELYTKIYIDPFLGILSGTGLASVFLQDKKEVFYSARVLLSCSMLVLVKDVGMFFAVFLGIVYIVKYLLMHRDHSYQTGSVYRKSARLLCIPFVMAAVMVPKALWSYNIRVNHATVIFDGAVDLKILWKVLTGCDETYRRTVYLNFCNAVITRTVTIGNTSLSVSYLVMLLLLFMMLLFLCRYLGSRQPFPAGGTQAFLCILAVQALVYIPGLCVTYMFKFSGYEAVNLASFERYMNIFQTALLVLPL